MSLPARLPCGDWPYGRGDSHTAISERKFQSHPTDPLGRLIELAFALAVWGRWFDRYELLWGVEPHYIPWQGAVGAACLSPPPLDPST